MNNRVYSEMSVDELEVPLYETAKERQLYDEMGELYAIIMATEHLERSFARDAVDPQAYTDHCKRLIAQFAVAEHCIKDEMSTETFMKLYQMDCPRALERLVVIKTPQIIKQNRGNHAVTVADSVQYFVTLIDALAMDNRAVDELQPILSDLLDSLTRLSETPNDFEPNRKVQHWLTKLNSMKATDEIDKEEARQLKHDMDSAYSEFSRYLRDHGSS